MIAFKITTVVCSLSLFFLVGCRQNKYSFDDLPSISDKKCSFKKETIRVAYHSPDSTRLSMYSYSLINDNLHLIAQNKVKKSIEIYNVSKKEHVVSIPVGRFNFRADSLGTVQDMYFYSLDSIFFYQEFALSIADTTGIHTVIPINQELKSNKLPLKYLFAYQDFQIYYNPIQKYIAVNQYCAACPRYEKKFLQTSVETVYRLNDNRFQEIPVPFSRVYFQENFGLKTSVARSIGKDSLHIYTFPVDPNIYVYDIYRDSLTIKPGKSKFHLQTTSIIPNNKKQDLDYLFSHFERENTYQQTVYDDYRGLYYRLFAPAIPLKNEEGYYNTFNDKRWYLMVFDSDFKLMDEIPLDASVLNYLHVAKEGLFIPKRNTGKEDSFNGFVFYDLYIFKNE